MKCDELKHEQWLDYAGEPMPCYPKAEVDAAIAELKARNVMFHDEAKYYKAENESLKSKLESVQATHYAEMVDAGMRERRLNRALWLARAKSAENAVGEIHNAIVCMLERKPKMSFSNTEAQEQVWKKVASKCRAMAEKYR